MIDAGDALRREAAAQGEAHNHVLRIGCFASIARARLPALLQKFRKLHPEIKIDVLVGGYELAAALEQVTKERIVAAAQTVKPDTVYFLRGKEEA